jgi:Fe-S oxidoreductase
MNAPVTLLSDVPAPAEIEVLYWVGCAAASDERLHRVAQAMVRIMQRASVRFAVLGSEEQCTGDPARRTGNEMHYDQLARANVATLNKYRVRQIVTHCPHCYHTLKNEYPAFGGWYDVFHHSEFLLKMLEENRLALTEAQRKTLTFHDPCYLGRYNGIFDAPREALRRLGMKPVEMKRSRSRSLCCGAGGGHAFFEDGTGGEINVRRIKQAAETGSSTVCTACPFCLSMLEDAVRGVAPKEGIEVRDLAELIDELLVEAEAGSHI